MKAKDRFNKGIDLLKRAEYQKALKIFDELVQEFTTEADFVSERGVVKFHLQDNEGALKDMDEAIRLQPLKSYRYSSRAYIRGHSGMVKKAIDDYKKAIELDPEDAVAYNNLGLLEEKLGYIEQSKRRFKLADELINNGENRGRQDQEILGKALEGRNIQKEIDTEKANQSIWSVMKSLSSKEGRGSFIRFVSSGFKQT
jgi:tetratricopeptide (TPR) repeat protein